MRVGFGESAWQSTQVVRLMGGCHVHLSYSKVAQVSNALGITASEGNALYNTALALRALETRRQVLGHNPCTSEGTHFLII